MFSLPILFKIPGFNTKETYDKFILSKTVETFIDRKKSTFLTHTVHQKAVMMMMMMLDDVAMPGTTSFHPTGRGASETGVLGSRFCVVGIFGGNISEQKLNPVK